MGCNDFIRERRYLKNVSPSTISWYTHALKWLLSESPSQRDLKEPWVRTVIKLLLLFCLFLFVMNVASFHNWLSSRVLASLTRENYSQMTMAFFAFIFSATFALSNTVARAARRAHALFSFDHSSPARYLSNRNL